ncbi:MAG: type III polyketide synthase [Deltaproteobacteria bacterium]|nr:type III polyketide synthase [Deltaproteobacteria bacterium]
MSSPSLVAVGTALPPHYVEQERLIAALRTLWAGKHHNADRIDQLHRAVRVSGRHLALPMEQYLELDTFQKQNDAWIRAATDLGEAALHDALARANMKPEELDHIFVATVTGIATPSIDARLANRMGLRADVKRTPLFGLGCVAGAAGTARASDTLRAFPKQTAALLSVELCSLTLQRSDLSIQNVIASGLFGDGAAALIIAGGERARRGPEVLASRSALYPDSERVMGWDVTDGGFKVVLSAQVPEIIRSHIRRDVDAFLRDHGLTRRDVRHWVSHPGGPKILDAVAEALELPREALRLTWDSLEKVGNLSSASVLFVLRDTLDQVDAKPGDHGLMLAMGPGFCSELVLLRW